jgi:hypothetical protein
MWSRLLALGRKSKIAVDALTRELEIQLDWYRNRGEGE